MDNLSIPADSPGGPDSTEQRIFDAAHDVFVQKGLDGAKMQEIADRAGINKALLHYYYRSKEKLYETVARAVINRAFPVIRKMLESDDPLELKISRFIDFYIDLVSRNPFLPLFVITEMHKHQDRFFETVLSGQLPQPEVFFQQVESAIAEGRIRPLDPRHLLVNMVSMCAFPVLGRPMIRVVLGQSQQEMSVFLGQRKAEVKEFIFQSIRP